LPVSCKSIAAAGCSVARHNRTRQAYRAGVAGLMVKLMGSVLGESSIYGYLNSPGFDH
jgi:hypothetical protein